MKGRIRGIVLTVVIAAGVVVAVWMMLRHFRRDAPDGISRLVDEMLRGEHRRNEEGQHDAAHEPPAASSV